MSMRQAAEAQLLTPHCDLGEEGLRQILTCVVEEVRRCVSQDLDGGELLHSLLEASWLRALLRVYECLQAFLREAPPPVLEDASGVLLQLLMDVGASGSCSEDVQELCCLLGQPHLQALLSAHDAVARRAYAPVLPPMPQELPEDEEATRTVCLVKNNQALGATIKRHELSGEIFIARVIHGGLADRSGLLHAGDRIVEVNGLSVGGMEPEQVIQVVARSQGSIMFKVVPITERPVHRRMMLYVRALVNYSPQQDPAIPCADAGVAFGRGDILEVVDQTDALWWQARKLPDHDGCAGLVPSSSLLQRKQRELWWSQPYLPHTCVHVLSTVEEEDDLVAVEDRCEEADEETFEAEELREEDDGFGGAAEGSLSAGFRRSLRLCRRRFYSPSQPARCPGSCGALSAPYEEVVRYRRQPQDPHRLVALLGPSGVGVTELRKRLIRSDPGLFQGAVPHTTRAPKGYEEPGRDYHYTSRETFDSMIHGDRFLEYGEFKGNLYGTSVQAVADVLGRGKICVLDIEPNAIPAVRTHQLKAFVVYVKPPPLERLRESRRDASVATSYYVNRPFRDEDFQEMEAAAQKMEAQYWQFFDQVLVNDQLQDSCAQLLAVVKAAQDEPQWVPSSWIRPSGQL